jgi:hypothetical protein
MEDSLKSQPDKEGKVSKLSLFDIGDESTGLVRQYLFMQV